MYCEWQNRNSWWESRVECCWANLVVEIILMGWRVAEDDLVKQISCSVAMRTWWPSGLMTGCSRSASAMVL